MRALRIVLLLAFVLPGCASQKLTVDEQTRLGVELEVDVAQEPWLFDKLVIASSYKREASVGTPGRYVEKDKWRYSPWAFLIPKWMQYERDEAMSLISTFDIDPGDDVWYYPNMISVHTGFASGEAAQIISAPRHGHTVDYFLRDVGALGLTSQGVERLQALADYLDALYRKGDDAAVERLEVALGTAPKRPNWILRNIFCRPDPNDGRTTEQRVDSIVRVLAGARTELEVDQLEQAFVAALTGFRPDLSKRCGSLEPGCFEPARAGGERAAR